MRIILAFLLGLAVPCSAQTGLIAMMLCPMGLGWLALYWGILWASSCAGGRCTQDYARRATEGCFGAAPPAPAPARQCAAQVLGQARAFVQDALPLFVLGAVLVSVLDATFTCWSSWSRSWPPIRVAETASSGGKRFHNGNYPEGFWRRRAAGFRFGGSQLFVALVTITLFVPCIATLLVLVKEHGAAIAAAVWLVSIITAVAVG